jgi:hypothetical protein
MEPGEDAMKFLKLRVEKSEEKQEVTLWTPWISFTLSFCKKRGQLADERNHFEWQMDAIREGKRKDPVMMTLRERHQETANEARKLKWSMGFLDSWGALAGFEAIRDHTRPQGSVVGFLSVLTAEEREEICRIIREEVIRVMTGEIEKQCVQVDQTKSTEEQKTA